MSSVSRDRNRLLTRIFSAAGLLLFVSAFLVAPLANAWMLCTMSCCHHGSSVAKIAAKPMAACRTECGISAPESTIPVAPNVSQNSPAAFISNDVVQTARVAASAALVELQPDTSPHGLNAPIHLLNSTFRI